MRVRRVDADGDMVFGGGQRAFWRDVPDGVAQIVESRLQLYQGDWYRAPLEGMPWRTEVLGRRTEATRDPAIRDRILSTPGVTEITEYSSVLDRETRRLAVAATISTLYGQAVVQETL